MLYFAGEKKHVGNYGNGVLMFSVGDLVVYSGEGVCRVEHIGAPSVSQFDSAQAYYHLQPLYRSGTVMTPVETKVLMRHIMTAEAANAFIEQLPTVSAADIPSGNPRLAKDCYHQCVMSYDCAQIVSLIKALVAKRTFALANGKKTSQLDERYLKRAQEHLYGELAAALDMDRDDMEGYIQKRYPSWPEEA